MNDSTTKSLTGKIAVVAGATRGAGRGIACMLGEAGATVYCTGRSVRGKPASGDRPETIEETAELVTEHGGTGIHVQVDHTDETQVEALFERIRDEYGHLDILVNDVWGGDALTEWGTPIWKMDLSKGFLMLQRAVNAHIITSRYGIPLMLQRDEGIVIEITDGDAETNRHYRGTLFYDLAKINAIRLAYAMSCEFRDLGLTAVALTPGFLRSEMMLEHFGVTEDTWRDGIKKDEHFAHSETPFFVGRAVAALAADPEVKRKSGQALTSWALAKEYGFVDQDGTQPDIGGHFDRETKQRWSALVEAIRTLAPAESLNPDRDLFDDFDHYELKANITPGNDDPDWFERRLAIWELLMQKPEQLAREFIDRYKIACDRKKQTLTTSAS